MASSRGAVKKAIDWRDLPKEEDKGRGFLTRWKADLQWSFVHLWMRSPPFTTKAFGGTTTGINSPEGVCTYSIEKMIKRRRKEGKEVAT